MGRVVYRTMLDVATTSHVSQQRRTRNMKKTIKVEDKVYHQLDRLRGKRETFSDVVAKLLTTKEGVDLMFGIWHNQYGEREPENK